MTDRACVGGQGCGQSWALPGLPVDLRLWTLGSPWPGHSDGAAALEEQTEPVPGAA